MIDRPALNDQEAEAMDALVTLAAAMLAGHISYFEGAVQVLRLKPAVGGVANRDVDFDAFVVIESESDHLPLKAQQHLWNPEVLAKLRPELETTEEWAGSFAPAALISLIKRFGDKTG